MLRRKNQRQYVNDNEWVGESYLDVNGLFAESPAAIVEELLKGNIIESAKYVPELEVVVFEVDGTSYGAFVGDSGEPVYEPDIYSRFYIYSPFKVEGTVEETVKALKG